MSEAQLHSPEAEAGLVGMMLAKPKQVAVVIGSQLRPEEFYSSPNRALYEQIVETYYADEPIDALVVGQACARRVAKWRDSSESEAIQWVGKLKASQMSSPPSKASTLAAVVKRYANYRHLMDAAAEIQALVEEGVKTPEEIAGRASQLSMQIATDTVLTDEILSHGELGRRFVRNLQRDRKLRALGIELGVKFGWRFTDGFTRGIKPTELLIIGGEPGVGKSAVSWRAVQGYADRQMARAEPERMGTLILSLEMGEYPSSMRVAQALTGIDSGVMREADITDAQMRMIIQEWARTADWPLWTNHTSQVKASQMKALIVEAIRRHNIGTVVIDHFRYFDLDQRLRDMNQEDEEKSRFLKEEIAKDLNVAVICLAHTIKAVDTPDHRPQLRHLRGSGQVAAHADFVGFVHRPIMYATEDEILSGQVKETDAEMIWAKNRHSLFGSAPFYMDLSQMVIRDK